MWMCFWCCSCGGGDCGCCSCSGCGCGSGGVVVVLFTCSRVLLGLLGSSVLEGLVALAGRLVQSEQGGQLGPVEPRQQR